MPRSGFKRNAKAIGQILKTVDGGKRAAAEQIAARLPADAEAELVVYVTDREVVGIRVRADTQARTGAVTRAANGG